MPAVHGGPGPPGQSTTVGVLLVKIASPSLSVMDGMQQVVGPSHYRAMIGIGGAQTHLEIELIGSMIDHGLAGLVLVAPQLPAKVASHYARPLPTVLVACHGPGATPFDTVNSDDRQVAALATGALLARAPRHRLPGRPFRPVAPGQRGRRAREGVPAGHGRRWPQSPRRRPPRPSRRARSRSRGLPRPSRPPHAVACWSDLDAIPLRGLAARAGFRVPEDLALVGSDNSPMAGLPLVDPASIDTSGPEIGRLAAQALLDRLGGRSEPRHLLAEPRPVVRSSLEAGAPRQHLWRVRGDPRMPAGHDLSGLVM